MLPADHVAGGTHGPGHAPVQRDEQRVAASPAAPMTSAQSFTPFTRLPSQEVCPFGVSQELAAIEALAVQLPLPSLEALARWLPQVVEARRTLDNRPSSTSARPSEVGSPQAARRDERQTLSVQETAATLLPGQVSCTLTSTGSAAPSPRPCADGSDHPAVAAAPPAPEVAPEVTATTTPMADSLLARQQEDAERLAVLQSAQRAGGLGQDTADTSKLTAAGGDLVEQPGFGTVAGTTRATPETTATLNSVGAAAPASTSSYAMLDAQGQLQQNQPGDPMRQACFGTCPAGDLFSQLDANRDGVLSREEFSALQAVQQQASPSAYDELGDSVSAVGLQQRPPAVSSKSPQESFQDLDSASREEAMRQVFALQERNRQLERRLAEERAIAMATSIENDGRAPVGMVLEDHFRAGIDNHLRGFEQVLSMQMEELVGQKVDLLQRAERLERELTEERANRSASQPASLAGTGVLRIPPVTNVGGGP